MSRCVAAYLLLVMPALLFARTTHNDRDAAWREYLGMATTAPPALTFPHASCFKAAALQYRVPETLLLAVARGESDFEPGARSKANAHGVMQIQWPGTAKHLGIHRLSELYEPCTNIDAGARYIAELLGRYDNNLHYALAAYNYGPSRISVGNELPDGAAWYSDYIYNHLEYVLGDGLSTNTDSLLARTQYSDLGRTPLVSFGEPYRAEAFVAQLRQQAPGLQLDWFRKGVGDFSVVLVYADEAEFDAGTATLARAGFVIH